MRMIERVADIGKADGLFQELILGYTNAWRARFSGMFASLPSRFFPMKISGPKH